MSGRALVDGRRLIRFAGYPAMELNVQVAVEISVLRHKQQMQMRAWTFVPLQRRAARGAFPGSGCSVSLSRQSPEAAQLLLPSIERFHLDSMKIAEAIAFCVNNCAGHYYG